MPLLLRKHIEDSLAEIAIWESTETVEWYFSQITDPEYLVRGLKYDKQKSQKLAIGMLLKIMLGEKVRIDHFHNGEPCLLNSDRMVSLSHSGKMSAIILSDNRRVGVDIQKIDAKIDRIVSKFVNDKELVSLENEKSREEHLHVIWGAKEALFKLYGNGGLLFKENLLTEDFIYSRHGEVKARITNKHIDREYSVHYERIKDYMLIYVVE